MPHSPFPSDLEESEQDKRQGKNQTSKIALHHVINSATLRAVTALETALLCLPKLPRLYGEFEPSFSKEKKHHD